MGDKHRFLLAEVVQLEYVGYGCEGICVVCKSVCASNRVASSCKDIYVVCNSVSAIHWRYTTATSCEINI